MERAFENPQSYADYMKLARVNAGLTVAELARETSIGESTIWAYENGRTCPTVAAADKLAAALNLTIDEYINGVVPRG